MTERTIRTGRPPKKEAEQRRGATLQQLEALADQLHVQNLDALQVALEHALQSLEEARDRELYVLRQCRRFDAQLTSATPWIFLVWVLIQIPVIIKVLQ